jgi:hypothetical protein
MVSYSDESYSEINIPNLIDIPNYKEVVLPVETLKAHMVELVLIMPIEPKIQKRIIANINATPNNPTIKQKDELEKASVVMHIMKEVVFDHAAEVAKGAHVMVNDNGALYDKLMKQGIVNNRYSSHHKKNKSGSDVSLQGGEIFREFLVGKTKDGKTWFQLEAHSTGGLKNLIGHLVDYIYYKCTGKNVGQYGLSQHIDSKPIDIDIKNIKAKMMQHLGSDKAVVKTNQEKLEYSNKFKTIARDL